MFTQSTFQFVRRISLLVVLAQAVFVFGAVNAMAQTASPGPIPSNYFGMSTNFPSDWPEVPVGSMGKSGVNFWPYVESIKGQYNWSYLDALVNQARAHG